MSTMPFNFHPAILIAILGFLVLLGLVGGLILVVGWAGVSLANWLRSRPKA